MSDADDEAPIVHPEAWVAPSAILTGKIEIACGVSVWHNVVARAECQQIRVGRYTNIQDFVMIHVGYDHPTTIGDFCSVTHHVTVHGCTLGDACLVGPNAVIMDGAEVGEGSIVAGGAFIPEGKKFPAHSIIAGVPGKLIAERDCARENRMNAWLYHYNAERTRKGQHRAWTGPECDAFRKRKATEIERDADL